MTAYKLPYVRPRAQYKLGIKISEEADKFDFVNGQRNSGSN